MARLSSLLCLASSLLGSFTSAAPLSNANSNSTSAVNVHWLGSTPSYHPGTTFGVPWPRGKHHPNHTDFSISGSGSDDSIPLQSWVTAYWPDGSIKWTGHAISEAGTIHDEYTLTASAGSSSNARTRRLTARANGGVGVSETSDSIQVDTGKIVVTFAKQGSAIIESIQTAGGKTVGRNGKLVLHSQSGVEDDVQDRGGSSINYFNFESNVEEVSVSDEDDNDGVRTLVTVRGKHSTNSDGNHDAWLPFVLRFYLYADSEAIRLVHSIVFDGDAQQDFIAGLGIRFQVPLEGEELYNRHVRLSGEDGGVFSEAVLGLTGLRRDPGEEVRNAQFEGRETPGTDTWDERVTTRLHWIPEWNDFSLSQLSPDGFTLKKRTKAGQSWVKSPGATRAGGLAYLGGATGGGLAVGLRDFWKRYPTGLDIRNAASDEGEVTLWLYSPAAEPLDLRPYHDGLDQETYEEQLDALEITYEDWEKDLDTPYGIARTNEIFIFGFESTPARDDLAALAQHINDPPVLVATPDYYLESGAIGTYWSPPDNSSETATTIETRLNFLLEFYQNQVEQRRWYGFLDHGDVMHTYDVDRHQWRYDIGGYAWDNSELSPDLFVWIQFLRTGRKDVYRFAEAMTRHTGEVDVYHIGPLKGLGTRHGVQHYSDSAKQARISNAQYRKHFYYLSGGDERVGQLLDETLDVDKTFAVLDAHRKVRGDGFEPTPDAVDVGLGTDYSALAASWLVGWERRGARWEEAFDKLNKTATGIAGLKNGFVTGSGIYNPLDGTLRPPPGDPNNEGVVAISHLSAVFGLVEVMAELTDHWGDEIPEGFEEAWLDYCYYYNAPNEEQRERYGVDFGRGNLIQAHSRLTAYAANKLGDESLAERAWSEIGRQGLSPPDGVWDSERLDGSEVLTPVDEASWVSTNDFAQYGLAAIQNLSLVGV